MSSVHASTTVAKHVLQHSDGSLALGCIKGFRKLRFKMYIYSDEALNELCKRITNGKKTLFGLGGRSTQESWITKRYPTAPVKNFVKTMNEHAFVQMLDECGTSKGCSSCGSLHETKIVESRKTKLFESLACHQVVCGSPNKCGMC